MGKATKSHSNEEALRRLHGNSAEERLLHRLHCVVLVQAGASAKEIAGIFGDSPRAVAYWVSRYEAKGLSGLAEAVRPGRPSKLSDSQMKKVRNFVQSSETKAQKLNAQVLHSFIASKCQVTFTPRQCWRLLNQLKQGTRQ